MLHLCSFCKFNQVLFPFNFFTNDFIIIISLMKLIALTFIFLFFTIHSQPFKRHELNKNSGARCLDGSIPNIYIHEGSQKDKILIFFQGGGFCRDLKSCFERTFTPLGTNHFDSEFQHHKEGICSPSAEKNPVFHDWVKVFVRYCDSSLYYGDVEEPKRYFFKKLYFRGSRNALETFKYLDKKYDLYNQKTVVLSGVSAGAVGAYYWVDYLNQHAKTSKVYAIPDSGVFLPSLPDQDGDTPLKKHLKGLLQIVGEPKGENVPPPVAKCLKDNGIENEFPCVGSSEFVKYIESPMFIVQSLYDAFSIEYIIGTKCACIFCLYNLIYEIPESLQHCDQKEMKGINRLTDSLRQKINEITDGKKNIGVWAPACVQHGFSLSGSYNSNHYRIPSKTGKKLYEGIARFLEDPNDAPKYMDSVYWPHNEGCSHLERFGEEIEERKGEIENQL